MVEAAGRLSRGSRAILALSLAGGLLIGGVASAHTAIVPTSLSLKASPSKNVPKHTAVKFSGVLSSNDPACKGLSRVNVFRVNDGFVGRTQTRVNGQWSLTKNVIKTATYQAVFDGKILSAVHPHSHTCAASASNTVTVTVK